MTTIKEIQTHPSRIRSIYYDPENPDPLHEVPAEDFFADSNISYIQKSVNKLIEGTGYAIEIDSILRAMKSIYQSSFLHRDFDYMNRAVINGVVQQLKDDIDFMKLNRSRNRWIMNYPPEMGITRMNSTSIKLNRKKSFAPVYMFQMSECLNHLSVTELRIFIKCKTIKMKKEYLSSFDLISFNLYLFDKDTHLKVYPTYV